MKIKAMYPLSKRRKIVKILLGISGLFAVFTSPSWLDAHITSWSLVLSFTTFLLVVPLLIDNYDYLFSQKVDLEINGNRLRIYGNKEFIEILIADAKQIRIQRSNKSRKVVLDIEHGNVNDRLIMCEDWLFYNIRKQGYVKNMSKLFKAIKENKLLKERIEIRKVMYVGELS